MRSSAIGVDTEFIGIHLLPYTRIDPNGFPDGECQLIDAPEIEDWSPLAKLMSDPDTVKILHDAQQDLNILYRACGACPRIFLIRSLVRLVDCPLRSL